MASESNVYVGSEVLADLQSNLNNLAGSLEELYNTMMSQMNSLNSFWQDAKYEEFKAGYSSHIANCQVIANNYRSWATGALKNALDRVIEVEKTDVSGSSISGGGAASAAGAAGVGTGVSGVAPSAGISGGGSLGSSFNLDGKKIAGSNTTSGAMIAQTLASGKAKGVAGSGRKKVIPRPGTKDFTDPSLDYCGEGQHKKVKSFTTKQSASHTDPTWDVGGEVGGEIGLSGPKGKAGISATRHSSKDSNNAEVTVNYECVPDDNANQ